MSSYFITATGTGIGKTYVTELLVRQHPQFRAIKPVMSGYADDSETDTHILARAQKISDIETISPWRFSAALSPDAAARREGKSIDFKALVEFCREQIMARDTLIEGVGGVMVPLTDSHTVLDWIVSLKIPAILVVGSYLGTLSHTLTAVTALRQKQVPIHAIIVSESEESPMPMEETAQTIERFTGITPVLLKRGAKKIDLVF